MKNRFSVAGQSQRLPHLFRMVVTCDNRDFAMAVNIFMVDRFYPIPGVADSFSIRIAHAR